MRPGESFEDAEVANFYMHRPEYPKQVFDKLVEVSPGRSGLLDIGCGTGKIARGLARVFDRVTGIDASIEMLRVGAKLAGDEAQNLTWVHDLAETASLEGAPFDLVVAAASIHWMDHSIVFPRLLSAAKENHVFAVVDGDGAYRPPWQNAWDDFLRYWIYELKRERLDQVESAFKAKMTRYKDWVDVVGETEIISAPVSQAVTDFVACQHSRDTFAPYKLGERMQRFDAELTKVLEPHAIDGQISYSVRTSVTWGSIRS